MTGGTDPDKTINGDDDFTHKALKEASWRKLAPSLILPYEEDIEEYEEDIEEEVAVEKEGVEISEEFARMQKLAGIKKSKKLLNEGTMCDIRTNDPITNINGACGLDSQGIQQTCKKDFPETTPFSGQCETL